MKLITNLKDLGLVVQWLTSRLAPQRSKRRRYTVRYTDRVKQAQARTKGKDEQDD